MLTIQDDTWLTQAIAEDLAFGDITTDNLFPQQGPVVQAVMRSRQPAVVSGIQAVEAVFNKLDPMVKCHKHLEDGDTVVQGDAILTLEGPVDSILRGERLALNFMQHLSGIATLTYQFVGAVSGTGTKIAHTRKTTPGLRHLEIQAVVHGGGSPHRPSLSHAVMIKDNHIQAVGSLTRAVELIREQIGHTVCIEVECDTPEQVQMALDCGVQVILLDNMSIQTLKDLVVLVNGRATLEASGGVTLSNVLDIARTGVNVISTSQITLGAPAVDIGLDF